MHAQILCGLHVRHATILDQAHRLKLELPRKLPPLHDAPPAPSKHLTRCLRNRVQAKNILAFLAEPDWWASIPLTSRQELKEIADKIASSQRLKIQSARGVRRAFAWPLPGDSAAR